MTRKPNSAVHVPPDVWAGVTREDAYIASGALEAIGTKSADWTPPERRIMDRYLRVAAALRRLAPYLPPEPPQEAVQAGDGREATPDAG